MSLTGPPQRPEPHEIEELLLGDKLRYTPEQTATLAGLEFDFAKRLWRAIGLAELPDDAVAFTADDVAAARRIGELLALEPFDEQTAIRLARAMGQTMARLAEWQVDIVTAALLDPHQPPTPDQIRGVLAIAELSMPRVEALIGHAWRRQVAAAGMRALAVATANEDVVPSRVPMAVGFSDLVAFTELSSELDEAALAALVEGFDATAADIATETGGRVVKTLGDEVLFVANAAPVVARIALRVAAAFGGSRAIGGPGPGGAGGVPREGTAPGEHGAPPGNRVGSANGPRVRTGLAFGPVLPIMGDVFGPTVNRASRLTSLARPGTVLVDEEMAVALAGDDAFRLVRISPKLARGLGLVQPYVLRER